MPSFTERSINTLKYPFIHMAVGGVIMFISLNDATNSNMELSNTAREAYPPQVPSTDLSRAEEVTAFFQTKTQEIVLSGGTTIEIPSITEVESLRQSYAIIKQEEVRQKAESDYRKQLFDTRPFTSFARPMGLLLLGTGLFFTGAWRVANLNSTRRVRAIQPTKQSA